MNTAYLDGRQISGRELLGMLGVSENDLRDAELGLMGTEYESQFGSGREFVGEEVYNEQYEKTVAPENAEIDRVWIGDGGLLMFVAKIYSLAGADFYEYPMAAGYMFP